MGDGAGESLAVWFSLVLELFPFAIEDTSSGCEGAVVVAALSALFEITTDFGAFAALR